VRSPLEARWTATMSRNGSASQPMGYETVEGTIAGDLSHNLTCLTMVELRDQNRDTPPSC
jgi:hypothetical protein